MSFRRSDVPLFLAAALHAALFHAAFHPLNLWPLALAALAPLGWVALQARSAWSAAIAVYLTQVVMWLWHSRWLVQVTEAGYIAYCFFISLYAVAFVLLLRWAARQPKLRTLPMAVVVPVLWVGLEFLRGRVAFDGYPWYLIGHPLVEAPILAQSADLFGAYFTSFLAAMVSGALIDLMRHGGCVKRSETRHMSAKSDETVRFASLYAPYVAILAVIVVHAANLAYGGWRLSQDEALSPGPAMLIVQTNLPQNNKLRATAQEQVEYFNEFLLLTLRGVRDARERGEPIDVVVWPETMVPGFGFEPDTIEFLVEEKYTAVGFTQRMEELAEVIEAPLLVGSGAFTGLRFGDVDEQGRELLDADARYNSAYLIQGEPPYQRYDKVFLTPFGETMPYISNWAWLERMMLSFGARGMKFDLDRGDELRALGMEWNGREIRFATPICFEATMAWVCRGLVYERGEKRADVLVNMTNDAWFGWFGPGRVHHAQISRFRAIENRVPMVRAANSGVSVTIDSLGRMVDAIGPPRGEARAGRYGEPIVAGTLPTQPRLDARIAPYAMIGDLWGWLCFTLMLGTAGWAAAGGIRRRRMSRDMRRLTLATG